MAPPSGGGPYATPPFCGPLGPPGGISINREKSQFVPGARMDGENFEIDLECPACGAIVDYDDVEVVEGHDDKSGCPCCGESSPTEEWFA